MVKRKVVADTTENTFKYVSFTDQISQINADTLSSRLSLPGEVYDHETFFYQAIAKWNDLDYGDDYKAFLDDIPYAELATYAQLLHYQDQIVEALKSHLLVPGSKACVTLLDISVALIRDLKDDFYPHLWGFFEAIMELLEKSRTNIEILEKGFKTLAIIIQMHWRSIVTSMKKSFVRFSPLFGSNIGYIRRFAAEAFSFLLRKSSSIPSLTKFLYEKVAEDDDKNIKNGVVQLLYNGIKGTHQQFHSKTNELLTAYIDTAMNLEEGKVRETATDILVEVMKLCIVGSSGDYTKDITSVLIRLLSEQHKQGSEKNIELIMNIIMPWITERRGKNFFEPLELFDVLKNISSSSSLSQLNYVYLNLVSKTLVTYSSKFTDPASIRQLISGAAKNYLKDVTPVSVSSVFSFFTELIDLGIFDIWCISSVGDVINYILEKNQDEEILKPIVKFLAIYCMNRRPFEDALDSPRSSNSNLDQRRKPFFDLKGFTKIQSCITKIATKAYTKKDELSLHSLVAYPWLWKTTDKPAGVPDLHKALNTLLKTLNQDSTSLIVTYLLAYDLILLQHSDIKNITINDILSFVNSQNVMDEVTLRITYLLLSACVEIEKIDNLEYLESFAKALKPCFVCASGVIRRWALKILNTFDEKLSHGMTNDEGEFIASESAIAILLEAEETESNIKTYRRRAALIRKLNYKLFDRMLPEGSSTLLKQIPLQVTICQLFEKFTLLWPSVHDAIETYASSMPIDDFWTVFQSIVDWTTEKIHEDQTSDIAEPTIFGFLREPTGDYDTFRIQIFKNMLRFPDIVERRNKSMVETLIALYRNEYLPVSPGHNKTADLSKHDEIVDDETADKSIVDNDEDDEDEEAAVDADDAEIDKDEEEIETEAVESKKRFGAIKIRRRKASDALKHLLETFGRFNNPQKVHREFELHEMYSELLKSDLISLRLCAFNCILTYRYNFLTPYADQIKSIVEEKRFRDSLTLFSINQENSVIDNVHRGELMPYLLKIIYGTLNTHISGRAVARRNGILMYLGGCYPHEIQEFFGIMFEPLLNLIHIERDTSKQDLKKLCQTIVDSYDFSSTLSPRKLKSLLNYANDIAKRITISLDDNQKRFLYRLVLSMGLLIRLALENESSIEKYIFNLFKALRTLFFDTIAVLFNYFKKHEFSKAEIDCLWSFIIEPIILQHKQASTEHLLPGAIPRFFTSLAKLPMFYSLLIKPFSSSLKKETPISLIFDFLNSKECDASSKDKIIEGVSTLLLLRDEPSAIPSLPESKFKVRDGINMGTEILLTQLSKIIQFLVANIPTDVSQAKQLPLVYLDILNKLSEYVEDASVGEHFASTLLSYVENDRVKVEEKITAILQTISRLVRFVDEPRKYLRRLPKLFTNVTYRTSREALVSIVTAFTEHQKLSKEDDLVTNLKLLEDLEAWDKRRLNEPDQEKRHKALAHLHRLYTAAKISLDPLNVILFARSHAYTITSINDIALRSAASSAFLALVIYTSKIFSNNKPQALEILRQHLNPLITSNLRSKDEAVRHESILAFDAVITAFADVEPILLEPFKLLQNDDKDLDYFANVTHIQHHRRQRAFKRLALALDEGTIEIPFESLMRFIIPMAHPYFLLTEPKFTLLVTEALNLLRSVLKLAPWSRYYHMLVTYVHQLSVNENSKPYIRVIVAIVDAFHFDLKDCDYKATEFVMAKNPKKDKRHLGSGLKRANFQSKKQEPKAIEEVIDAKEEEIDDGTKGEKDKSKAILQAVLLNVLPKLQECIRPNHKLLGHKKSQTGKYFAEDEELKRVPLALATVKLLQKLPEWVLNRHLHNVVITLINLLMSRSSEVRQSARKTMQQVIQDLGVKHLPFFIKEMKQTMTKGYQVHVMIYTVHLIIQCLESQLKTGDLDSSVTAIIEVCKQEQFSDTTEEKELHTTVAEAKANKTGETYQFLGRFISYDYLPKVVEPMKEIFEAKPSSTTMKKLSSLLRSFVHGLRSNDGIPPEKLLEFTQSYLSSNLTEMTSQLAASQPALKAEEDRKKAGYRPESCLILPEAPKRVGAIVKTSIKAQSSIFVEFAVNLLGNLLKAKVFDPKKPEDVEKLDPFLPMIIGCLKTKYEKIIGVSLRCLHGLLKFPLPSIQAHKNEVIERLFVVLSDYAGLGSAGHQGSIQELSQNLFKCFNQMIHIAQASILTTKRLQILLNYCETDILDSQKQATAFALIKTILGKRIKDEKIITMMDYLAELSITSTITIVRTNCREIIIQYITNYQIGKTDAEKWLTFYLEQLDYEFEDGRLSALEMIHSIINAFTEEVNNSYALLIFIKLAARFVNEESQKCLKFVSLSLQKLLQTTTAKPHHELLKVSMDWLKTDKESTRVIGYKVTTELCKGLSSLFVAKASQITPILAEHLSDLSTTTFTENLVLSLFETFTTICDVIPNAFLETFIPQAKQHNLLEKLNDFLQCVASKAVQLSAATFLGQLLSLFQDENTKKFHKKLQTLFGTTIGWMKLCYSLCFQLKGKAVTEASVDQIVKNLVFLSNQIKDDEEYDDFAQKIGKVCSAEIVQYSTESLRRKGIFKLTAACALQCTPERQMILTKRLLPHLHREMMGKSSKDTEELQSLASEVGEILKEKIGPKEYASILIECSKKANEKAVKRKQDQATLAVTNPQAAAIAKRKKHEKKAENRKRKLDALKPYRITKRKARNDIRKKMENDEVTFFDNDEDEGDE